MPGSFFVYTDIKKEVKAMSFDWQQFFKELALVCWGLILLSLMILALRYSVRGLGQFFAWDQPYPYAIIGAVIVTLLAIVWPYLQKLWSK